MYTLQSKCDESFNGSNEGTDRQRERKKRPSPPKAPLPPQRHDKSVLTRWTVGRAVGAGVLGARRCVAALGPPGQGPRAAAPV